MAPFILALAALVFGFDQTHKWWMLSVHDIAANQPVTLTPFFELVLAWNRGVSYGLFSTHKQGFLIALALALTAVLWMWSCRTDRRLTAYALALVIGGALSNALDRAVHGAVADFFHFHWGSFSWYIFNIADVAIVAGVGLLLYESFFDSSDAARRGNA
jgi:signal peptidase II